MSAPILFDDFKPGAVMGETSLVFTKDLAAQWECIFGVPEGTSDRSAKGAGVATVMMMRAYMSIVAPRPAGNVHARQRISLDNIVEPNEVVTTRVRCLSKEVRRERRYVELDMEGAGRGGRPLYQGTMTLIWAS